MSLPTRHDSASSKSAAHQHSAGPGMMMLGVSASMIGHGVCTCIHVSGTVGHAPHSVTTDIAAATPFGSYTSRVGGLPHETACQKTSDTGCRAGLIVTAL